MRTTRRIPDHFLCPALKPTIAITLGVLSAYLHGAYQLAACIALVLVFVLMRRLALCLIYLAALLWCTSSILIQRADRLPENLHGQITELNGEVISLIAQQNEAISFLFRPETTDKNIPQRLRVSWYHPTAQPRLGEQWHFKLILKLPRGRVNFRGADAERWLFSQRIGAYATVQANTAQRLAETTPHSLSRIRQLLSEQILHHTDRSATAGMLLALSVGERSRVQAELWTVMQKTGTNHLLAISGLHISLIALFGWFVGRAIAYTLPTTYLEHRQHYPGVVLAIGFASLYAAVAGFSIPTQRALIMLAGLVLWRSLRRAQPAWSALRLAMAGILLLEPLSALSQGFWLSFAAVAVLLAGQHHLGHSRYLKLVIMQAILIIGLFPIAGLIYGQVSLVSLLANLLAVPLIAWIILPLLMISLAALGCFPQAAGLGLQLTDWLLHQLFRCLVWLADSYWANVDLFTWSILPVLLVSVAAVWIIAGRGPLRSPLALLCCLPLVWPPVSRDAGLHLRVLDVGQGLAVLIKQGNYALLYDLGPGDGSGRDLVRSTIRPQLRGLGIRSINTVIVSHADLDHAGGRGSLAQLNISGKVYSSDGSTQQDCQQGQLLSAAQSLISVVHPSRGLPYLGNDSSCVLQLETNQRTVLLPGDIGSAVEQRLIEQGLVYPTDILLVPHHGSTSSSSQNFIQHLQPLIAVVSAGYKNRFRLPKPAVTQRYQAGGSHLFNTAFCGAIDLTIDPTGTISMRSARAEKPRFWRYPAADECRRREFY